MELKDTLRSISNARGWLRAWARDFTDSHGQSLVGEIAALRKILGKPRIG